MFCSFNFCLLSLLVVFKGYALSECDCSRSSFYLIFSENEDITSVDTTVKSHDPNIVGVLKTIPDVIYSEHLPLPLASKSGVVESQVQLSKRVGVIQTQV